ncbi:Zinc finger C2H2-type, partial [Cinara cedri]
MFACTFVGCTKVFNVKHNMTRHAKTHEDVKFQCALCPKVFTFKGNMMQHIKIVHHEDGVVLPTIAPQAGPSNIIIIPQAGPSNSLQNTGPINVRWTMDEENDALLADVYEAINDIEGFDDESRKRKNTETAANTKKARIDLVNTPGFTEIDTSHSRKIVWYYAKNIRNFKNYKKFLSSIKPALIDLLKLLSENNPIKFNLKLEATYYKPHVENSTENRAFKISAREIFFDSEIEDVIEEKFAKLLKEEDIYQGRGSGFSLQSIDGVLLGVYKYTPMEGYSYIPLPTDIMNKRAIIDPQNNDEKCFKWAILAKHVTDIHRERVNEKYTEHGDKYDFGGISFPTPLIDIKKFEKNNSNIS